MKVKVISRQTEEFTRQRSQDSYKTFRNYDPVLHPFERAREYTRALNATKLERLFAQPFVGALSGHIDGIYAMCRHPTSLDSLISGSGDGEIRIWSLHQRELKWKAQAHDGFVRGICSVPFSDRFFTVGDNTVKVWTGLESEPENMYISKHAFTGIDHHRHRKVFVTSSTLVNVWDHERSTPVHSMSWGDETVTTVKMNQVETNLLATCGSERTIVIYDLRTNNPISRTMLHLKSNAIAWNPIEAFQFTVANEDHNCYTFDMRRMEMAVNVLKDHVSAVMDLDYSPTGQEIVSGSYDRTLRIYRRGEGHSREIYHTKRMQRIFCVKYSADSKMIYSGSDDGNVRIWKSNSSEKLGGKTARQEAALHYAKALKEKYKHMPEVKRIDKHRRVPKVITSQQKTKRIQIESRDKKQANVQKHSVPNIIHKIPERKRTILLNE